MSSVDLVRKALDEAATALAALRANDKTLGIIANAAESFSTTLKNGGRIFSCGNGGSMCDAMHFAEELSGRFRNDRKPLAAIAISDPGYLSCTINDYGPERMFARFLEAHGRQGDALLAITTSGSSRNVLEAAKQARACGMTVVGLTGREGSALFQVSDMTICTPGGKFADRVQELHIKVIHSLIELIERHVCGV